MAETELPSAVGCLDRDQLECILAAAVAAPSLHNSQPWRFTFTPTSIELFADPARGPQVGDPDHRAVRMACGAALLNLKLAVGAEGVRPDVRMFPADGDRSHIATVSCERRAPVDAMTRRLVAAIPLRHTYRRPMLAVAVPDPLRAALRVVARQENAWLIDLPPESLSRVRDLIVQAQRVQQADDAFVAEWRSWTGRPAGSPDGVPMTSSGLLPAPQDAWVVRDFSNGAGAERSPGRDFEPDPLLVCIGTFVDGPLAQVQAGAALQRVLLRAAMDGVTASFLSQLIEVSTVRAEIRHLIGGALWPQIVVRIGYGGTTPATPRRSLGTVLSPADQEHRAGTA